MDDVTTTPQPGSLPPQPPANTWKDRVWALRVSIAASLAAVIVGGAGGAALAAASDGADSGRGGIGGPGAGRHGGPPRGFGQQGQQGVPPSAGVPGGGQSTPPSSRPGSGGPRGSGSTGTARTT